MNKSTVLKIIVIVIILLLPSCRKSGDISGFSPDPGITQILGRPTDKSVTVSILSSGPVELYWEYGTNPGKYTFKTEVITLQAGIPLEKVFSSLAPSTRYFYRYSFRAAGTANAYTRSEEHTFHTAKGRGSSFTFAVEADPHLDSNSDTSAYLLTLRNMASVIPDFVIDLGDTFFSEKQPGVNQEIINKRHLLFRPYFGSVCHSSPLFLVLGNHEGESGWLINGTATSIPVLTNQARKLYYPNPSPDSFYSGNNSDEAFTGRLEDYYAWEWGDALFVVLDPFWYTTTRPLTGWEMTLGEAQYNWFKNVLSGSTAQYKFVFCHNLVGGYTKDARGGAEYADYFEMGGNNSDGTWGFTEKRPGWPKPLHTLMKENNVTIFFHGHDHFYGKQEKDGIIYQEVPQPSNKSLTNISATQYGYVSGTLLPGRGYLKVDVSPAGIKVDYIKTLLPAEETGGHKNMEVADTYTINK